MGLFTRKVEAPEVVNNFWVFLEYGLTGEMLSRAVRAGDLKQRPDGKYLKTDVDALVAQLIDFPIGDAVKVPPPRNAKPTPWLQNL